MNKRNRAFVSLKAERQVDTAVKEITFDVDEGKLPSAVKTVLENVLFDEGIRHGRRASGRVHFSFETSKVGHEVYVEVKPTFDFSVPPIQIQGLSIRPTIEKAKAISEPVPFDQKGYIAGITKLAKSDDITANLMRKAVAGIKARKAAAKQNQ
ncbi:hypothetical protein [Spirosoma aerophilum]